ncbi:MAG: LysR family transcriptional regulator [Rhizobiaceae bacterium]
MNLKSIEAFVWAARLSSFSRAAERLNTTLATLSARISALEDELGTSLFDRVGRGVQLSAKGREVLMYAETVVMAADKFALRAKERAAYQGHLKLGLIDTAASVILPQLLRTLNRQYPNVDFDLISGTSERLMEALSHGELDIAVVIRQVFAKGIRSHRLFRMPLSWVASPELTGGQTKLTIEALASYPILSYSSGSLPHRQLLELLLPVSSRQSIYCGTSMATMLRLVEDAFAIAALPVVLLQDQISSGRLLLLEIEPNLPDLDVKIAFMDSERGPLIAAIADTARKVALDFCREQPQGTIMAHHEIGE